MHNSPFLTLLAHTAHSPRQGPGEGPWDSTTQGRNPAPPLRGPGFLSSLRSSFKGVQWSPRGFARGDVVADMDAPRHSNCHSQDGQRSEGSALEDLIVYEKYICPFTNTLEVHARMLVPHVMNEDRCPALVFDQGSTTSSSAVTTPESSPSLPRLPELIANSDLNLYTAKENPFPNSDLKSLALNEVLLCVVSDPSNKVPGSPTSSVQPCPIERAGSREGVRKTRPTAEFIPLVKRRVAAGAIKRSAGPGKTFLGLSEVTLANVTTVAPAQTASTFAVSNEPIAPTRHAPVSSTRRGRSFGIGEGLTPPGQFKRSVALFRQTTTLGTVLEIPEEEDVLCGEHLDGFFQEKVRSTTTGVSLEPELCPTPIPPLSTRSTRLFAAFRESVKGLFKAGDIGSDVASMRSSGSFGCKDRNAHLPSSDSFGCRDRNKRLEDLVTIIVTLADDDNAL